MIRRDFGQNCLVRIVGIVVRIRAIISEGDDGIKEKPLVSADNKALASHLAKVFDSPIKVLSHLDEREKHSVYVFYAPDRPTKGGLLTEP
jgi:hypothetical protein